MKNWATLTQRYYISPSRDLRESLDEENRDCQAETVAMEVLESLVYQVNLELLENLASLESLANLESDNLALRDLRDSLELEEEQIMT